MKLSDALLAQLEQWRDNGQLPDWDDMARNSAAAAALEAENAELRAKLARVKGRTEAAWDFTNVVERTAAQRNEERAMALHEILAIISEGTEGK